MPRLAIVLYAVDMTGQPLGQAQPRTSQPGVARPDNPDGSPRRYSGVAHDPRVPDPPFDVATYVRTHVLTPQVMQGRAALMASADVV